MRFASVWLVVAQLLPVASAVAATPTEPAVREPVEHVYATTGGTQLKAYVFTPDGPRDKKRSAIVLFHGGGWAMGEPSWAFARANRFADSGIVAIAAQYRLSDQKEVTPLDAMKDARAVIRWVREKAESLGVDPKRVAAYGWSAGGHLSASAAIFDSDGSAPDALVLVSPAVSLGTDSWVQKLLLGRASARDISPDEHVRKGLPPTLILQGDVDTVTPATGAKRFCERMRAAGNACEVHVYEGFGHLFTPAGIPDDGMPKADPAIAADATARGIRFLESLGFMK